MDEIGASKDASIRILLLASMISATLSRTIIQSEKNRHPQRQETGAAGRAATASRHPVDEGDGGLVSALRGDAARPDDESLRMEPNHGPASQSGRRPELATQAERARSRSRTDCTPRLEASERFRCSEHEGVNAQNSWSFSASRTDLRPGQWAHGPRWVPHGVEGERWQGFEAVRVLPGLGAEVLLVPLVGHSEGHCGVAIAAGGGAGGCTRGTRILATARSIRRRRAARPGWRSFSDCAGPTTRRGWRTGPACASSRAIAPAR